MPHTTPTDLDLIATFDIARAEIKEDPSSKGRGKRTVEGFAATTHLATDGAVITKEALEAAKADLSRRTTILLNHDTTRPIGRILSGSVEKLEDGSDGHGLKVRGLISDTENDVWRKIEEGVLSKFSIRFRVVNSSKEFSHTSGNSDKPVTKIHKLMIGETSVVSVPADDKAVMTSWALERSLRKGGNIPMDDTTRDLQDVKEELQSVEGKVSELLRASGAPEHTPEAEESDNIEVVDAEQIDNLTDSVEQLSEQITELQSQPADSEELTEEDIDVLTEAAESGDDEASEILEAIDEETAPADEEVTEEDIDILAEAAAGGDEEATQLLAELAEPEAEDAAEDVDEEDELTEEDVDVLAEAAAGGDYEAMQLLTDLGAGAADEVIEDASDANEEITGEDLSVLAEASNAGDDQAEELLEELATHEMPDVAHAMAGDDNLRAALVDETMDRVRMGTASEADMAALSDMQGQLYEQTPQMNYEDEANAANENAALEATLAALQEQMQGIRSALSKVQVIKGDAARNQGSPEGDFTETSEWKKLTPENQLNLMSRALSDKGGFGQLRRVYGMSSDD